MANMTNTLTNTLTNTYVVIFFSVSIFGRGYHSRYQNFEFTGKSPKVECTIFVPCLMTGALSFH